MYRVSPPNSFIHHSTEQTKQNTYTCAYLYILKQTWWYPLCMSLCRNKTKTNKVDIIFCASFFVFQVIKQEYTSEWPTTQPPNTNTTKKNTNNPSFAFILFAIAHFFLFLINPPTPIYKKTKHQSPPRQHGPVLPPGSFSFFLINLIHFFPLLPNLSLHIWLVILYKLHYVLVNEKHHQQKKNNGDMCRQDMVLLFGERNKCM